ncbi:MAG: hypothetical protein ABIG69_11805 [Bacteroidota bacterium]
MEKPEYGKIGVGEDRPQMKPAKVVIADYKVEPTKNKKGEDIGDKLVLIVDHPDVTDKCVEISGAKYSSGDKLKSAGLWLRQDTDGKIPYRSAVGNLLRHLEIASIDQIKGKVVDTLLDDNGYLVVKAY